MATKREVELELRRRIAFWHGALHTLQFTCQRMLQPGLWIWIDKLEGWAYSAGDPSAPKDPPRPERGCWPPTPDYDWVDASCAPDAPGRYLVTIECAAEEGVPASERVDIVSWGEYAFAAPKGFAESDLLPGQRFCPRDRAVHGFGWHAYDRTTDACTVWHPSRQDERVTHWCGVPGVPKKRTPQNASQAAPQAPATQAVAITLTTTLRSVLARRLRAATESTQARLVEAAARRSGWTGAGDLPARLSPQGEAECTALHAELLSIADQSERAADRATLHTTLALVRILEPHIPPGERAFPDPQKSGPRKPEPRAPNDLCHQPVASS